MPTTHEGKDLRHYWSISNKLAKIDEIVMKCKRLIIPFQLQKQVLQQLHGNHIGIEKMRLLVCWLNMNAYIEITMNQYATCLVYQKTQSQEKKQYQRAADQDMGNKWCR